MTIKRRTLLESGAMGAAFLSMAGACARQDQSASNDLAELDAVETASRIKSGALSAAEAVDAAIDRAQKIEPQITPLSPRLIAGLDRRPPTPAGLWRACRLL